ncbi:hypothetical protein [Pseudovibrio sp. Ad37]|uniref:hypothetical protein n=1 Tax=Pseudovibrio sp. Ad37 TaxID=989422 RepID=UPI0007B1DAAC|nr:hypothetical protein [Pseudovibrio sp. Ad37]KZL29639.1 hypothetical protein PsAD37_00038 [Pseudovibrio sp. Ad37]
MLRPLIFASLIAGSALVLAGSTWALTQTRAVGPGLTQISAPSNNALKPISADSKLIRYPAKSALKQLKAKSRLVRLEPKSKLIRYRVKTADATVATKPASLTYAHVTGVLSYVPRQELDDLLAFLNKDIYQLTGTHSAAGLVHKTSWRLQQQSSQILENVSSYLP